MTHRMASRSAELATLTSASSKLAESDVAWVGSFDPLIAEMLPPELQPGARDLVRAVAAKVAVAEHFDAFCGQAFSKPEWAAAASPLIAEIFERDEDLLAELARIPDLIIEMSCGQVTMTCMVASRWAARIETHRLSRLADAMVASHTCKNAASVDVMLALAATLAVTRHSRAEQLYNAALPLTGPEHQEAIADARQWLAAGRVVCSISPDERDFWDTRLRKPKHAWQWQSKEERHALETLAEQLHINEEAEGLFQAVVPPCWWDLSRKCARQQELLAEAVRREEQAKGGAPQASAAGDADRAEAGIGRLQESAPREFDPRPKPGPYARFVLGWICGAMAMALTVVLMPAQFVQRVFGAIKPAAAAHAPRTTAQQEAWRKENLEHLSGEMADFAKIQAAAKNGTWADNEGVLSGKEKALPLGSPNHLKLLAWLHLDPPADQEMRARVARLLVAQAKAGAISLWEELIYPGSPNAGDIRNAARDALADSSLHWNDAEKERLKAIVASGRPEEKKAGAP